jgi:hypothetical protein
MNDRPNAVELLDAVRAFLEKELLPSLTDARLRFQTLVAANVLAVAGRELTTREEHLAEEWSLMDAVLGKVEMPLPTTELAQAIARRNDDLCQRIRAGKFDEAERARELSGMLHRVVVRKLEVANPRLVSPAS